MGLSHLDAAAQAARLRPNVPVEGKTEAGHKRGQTVVDHRRGGDAGLRGIPVIGIGAGAISLTAPGGELGNAARLEQAGRDLNEAARRIIRERTRYKA